MKYLVILYIVIGMLRTVQAINSKDFFKRPVFMSSPSLIAKTLGFVFWTLIWPKKLIQ
jgi:hypothetical protein